MSVLVVGISHKSAPVALLERVALDRDGVNKLLGDVVACDHVSEAAVIATCNRLEIYAEVDRFHGSVEEVSRLLVERAGESTEAILPHLYVHYDDGAVSHLFHVAAGLDSMAVGEGQILGQTREALRRGQEQGTVGPALNVLFQQALRVGKRSRAETDIDLAAPSLVSAALERVAGPLGGVKDKSVVVVGAGAMAGLATATVSRLGAADVTVVNRTATNADRLAAEYGARSAPLSDLPASLADADLVITCTGATGILLDRDMVQSARPDTAPLAIVDLALPHDVDPAVGDLPGVTLVRLADLADELRDTEAGHEVDGVRHIVGQEVTAFLAARRQASVTPTVVALRSMATAVVEAEMERLAARLPRPRRGRPGRGPAVRAPGRRQAAPPADRPGQGARQRDRCGVLRHRPRRAVRARPRGGRRRHPTGGHRDRPGALPHAGGAAMTAPRQSPLRLGTRASLLATTQSRTVAELIRARLGPRRRAGRGHHRGRPQPGVPGNPRRHRRLRQRAARRAAAGARSTWPSTRSRTSPPLPRRASPSPPAPSREDPRDVVVARDGLTLGELPAGTRVGTGSPRRVAQLHALGLGLEIADIRGNVDTRIGKVRSGEYDAVVLARAGLARLGRLDEATEVLDPLQMLPAPGQGALAVECRADDVDLRGRAGRARRPAHAGGGRGRARRARHARRWLLGPDRRPGRGGRGRRRGRDLGQGRGPVPTTGRSRCGCPHPGAPPTPQASGPAWRARCSPTGQHD